MSHDCSEWATCKNLGKTEQFFFFFLAEIFSDLFKEGSWKCDCNNGFNGSGTICNDIDRGAKPKKRKNWPF